VDGRTHLYFAKCHADENRYCSNPNRFTRLKTSGPAIVSPRLARSPSISLKCLVILKYIGKSCVASLRITSVLTVMKDYLIMKTFRCLPSIRKSAQIFSHKNDLLCWNMSADLDLPVGLTSRFQPFRRISLAQTCKSPRSCMYRCSPSRKRITCIAQILPRTFRKSERKHMICSYQSWMMEGTLDLDSREIIRVAPFNDPVESVRNHITSTIIELQVCI
jgi:hypothetical protein